MKTFPVGLLHAPTAKAYVGGAIAFLIVNLWIYMGQLSDDGSEYFDLIVMNHWWTFWIVTTVILFAALAFTIYEQQRYRVRLSLDKDGFILEQGYANSSKETHKIFRSDVQNISLETNLQGSNTHLFLLIHCNVEIKEKFSVSARVAKELLQAAEEFGYPIKSDVWEELKFEQGARSIERWSVKASIIVGFAILFLGITIPLVLIWANGWKF